MTAKSSPTSAKSTANTKAASAKAASTKPSTTKREPKASPAPKPGATAASSQSKRSSTAKTSTATSKAASPSAAKPSPKKETPLKSEPKKSGAFGSLLSAIFGALIALFGFLFLQTAELIPSQKATSSGTDVESLAHRLAVLENLPAPEIPNLTDVEDLKTRIATIEAFIEAPTVPEAVEARLNALETKLSQIESTAPLNPASDQKTARNPLPSGISDRLAAIEEQLNGSSQQAASQEDARLEADQDRLLQELSAELAGLKSDFQTLKENRNTLVSKLTTLTTKIDSAEKTLTEQSDSSDTLRTVAQRVALDNFKRIAQSGAPFAPALQALKSTGLSNQNISLIEAYADKGLPDARALKTKLDELIGTALARSNSDTKAPEAPQSAFDKLLKNARSVIKIRKIGDTAGAGQGPFNEMQSAFREENLSAFKQATNKLETKQIGLFSNWIADWEALLAVKKLELKSSARAKNAPPNDASTPTPGDPTSPDSTQ